MSQVANPRDGLSNFLTPDYRQYEREGDFASVVRVLEPRLHRGLREKAALARAYAFLGREEDACRMIREVRAAADESPPVFDPETELRALLAQARVERAQGKFVEAAQTAQIGWELSQNHGDPSVAAMLGNDAKFAYAFAQAELGKLFVAADLFQSIAADTRAAGYRRGLSQMNEAWIRWDLGNPEYLRGVRDRIPPGFLPRVDLCLEFLDGDGDSSLARRWSVEGPPVHVAAPDRFDIAKLCTEFLFIYDPAALAHARWLHEYFRSDDVQRDPGRRAIATLCRRLWGDSDRPRVRVESLPWRFRLYFTYLTALIAIDEDVDYARRIWRDELNPQLAAVGFRSPLMPAIDADRLGGVESPWRQRLERRLFPLQVTSASAFSLEENEVVFQTPGHPESVSLSLRRQPITLALLRLLGGRRGDSFQKSYLHEKLTRSRYVARLHDGRLQKLLKRSEAKFTARGLPCPWQLPGDGSIVLRYDLRRRETGEIA
ncbi:MAG: hypothetical protein AB7P04_12470 [Bacteriovoracia bacterium]